MKRTTIMLPGDLRAKAKRVAKARGVTLGELVREALADKIAAPGGADAIFRPVALPEDVDLSRVPRDLAGNHDKYLYGDPPC